MPSIPKTSRREHSSETLAVIISMHEQGKSHAQIGDHLKLAKSTVTSIIHHHNRQPEHLMGISGLRLERNRFYLVNISKLWTDEAIFETGLDTRSCYVTRKHGTAMEVRYLKPIFKSGRSSIGIWGAITLGLKGPVHFLQKERRMNSEIYINQVLKELELPFFKRCVEERGDMIWMDDGAVIIPPK